MAAKDSALTCPHCGSQLLKIELPSETGWAERPQWVCFNDDCSYFLDGWTWMWDNYRAKASYRFRVVDVESGTTSPLPVWSATALRDRIVAEKTTSEARADDNPENPS